MASVELQAVTKAFGGYPVIHGLDLSIEDGSFTVFVGPSGCGKSTLLRLVAGLEDVSGGTVKIGGADVTDADPVARGIAMVFQNYALYPHMSVRQNIGFPLRMQGLSKAIVNQRVSEAADILQLGDLLERKPAQLSGGQRQRVAIGRSIVRNPDVFLFDEPLSNLDAELRVSMRVEIARLHKTLGTTMIYVTHDQTEAMTLADKIVVLRAGRIEQVGSPEDLYTNPATLFVAGFIGSPRMNFLKGTYADGIVTLTNGVAWGPKLATDAKTDILVGVRPEHFVSSPAAVTLPLTVDLVEYLGGTRYVYATYAGDQQLTIEERGTDDMQAGSPRDFPLDISKALYFSPQGERLYAAG